MTTLDSLYRAYHRELYGYCVNQVGPDAADDASGDLWLRAVRAWPRYEEQHQGRAWLYAIARSVCLDHKRYHARRPTVPLDATGAMLSAPDMLADVEGRD
jgi:RNA polymerase sigma-70 factor (ECF subfamily)